MRVLDVTLPVIGALTTAEKIHTVDLVIDIRDFHGNVNLTQLIIGAGTQSVNYGSGPVTFDNLSIQSGSVMAGTFTVTGRRWGQLMVKLPVRLASVRPPEGIPAVQSPAPWKKSTRTSPANCRPMKAP